MLTGTAPPPGPDDDDDATPVESFPNVMLDACTARLRAKSQDVQALLNQVCAIFDGTGKPLPHAEQLSVTVAPPPPPAAAAPPATPKAG